MGASSSNKAQKSEISGIATLRSILPFQKRKQRFINGNKTFATTILSGPFAEEVPFIEKYEPSKVKANLAKLFHKYQKELKKEKITESIFNIRVRELYVEPIIKKTMLNDNFEIFKFIAEKYTQLNIGTCDSKEYKDALYVFEKEFDVKLSMITYSLLKIGNLPIEEMFAINRHLKFNSLYQPNVFNLILNEKLLSNKELLDDLCDLISYSDSIKIICIILYPKDDPNGELATNFGLTCATYKSLFNIMRAVNKNKNIKGLFLHCVNDYDISLAPEIFDTILKKLQSESLIAFHFGNFKLSEGLLNKLLFQISGTRCLKFLSLHLVNVYKILTNSLLQSLIKNVSLYAFAVTNLNMKNDKKVIEEFKKKIDEHIKDVTINNKSNIELYYVKDKSLPNLVISN